MPLFVCDKCHATDNTACGGTYWTRNADFWPDDTRGKVLCVECAPLFYKGGEPNKGAGKWHGRFEKSVRTEDELRRDIDHYVYLGPFEHLRQAKP